MVFARLAPFILVMSLSSCALLEPSASIQLSRVSDDYYLDVNDTTKTIITMDSDIDMNFDLSGSERLSMRPGFSHLLASDVVPGWYYMDIIGASMWVRGVPVYLWGGDTISIEVGNDYLDIDGKIFFEAEQQKGTQYPFVPAFSLNCVGCTRMPQLKFDDQQVNYLPPWVSIAAGWHTIEIYSPFDNVRLYYRTLFDNYSITQFTFYPVTMN